MLSAANKLANLTLKREPEDHDKSLRAWNAADEWLIDSVCQQLEADDKTCADEPINVLIVNDQFGAIAVALANLPMKQPSQLWLHLLTDSKLAATATSKNLRANQDDDWRPNQVNFSQVNWSPKDQSAQLVNPELKPFARRFDYVLIRVPKHNSLLQMQLQLIAPYIDETSQIIAGGMTKEIHTSNIKLFSQLMGETRTSLARKKARLIYCQPIATILQQTTRQKLAIARYALAAKPLTIYGLPGVFSRQKLDLGAKVLLEHLPLLKPKQTVADLGCGNGVIGTTLAHLYPDAELTLIDESSLAVSSAEFNFWQNKLSNGHFYHSDIFTHVPDKQFDHILCNPPFHQQNAQTLSIAKNMFRQSSKRLKTHGELRVVANRHLPYAALLKRYFTQVKAISKNKQFIVWLAKGLK